MERVGEGGREEKVVRKCGNHNMFISTHIFCRVGKLEGEVSSLSERVNELLVEKEKALADLKTIRKANLSTWKSELESLLSFLSSLPSPFRLPPSFPPPPIPSLLLPSLYSSL